MRRGSSIQRVLGAFTDDIVRIVTFKGFDASVIQSLDYTASQWWEFQFHEQFTSASRS